ncbi:hypothetical protein PUNSTDRAFT_117576 [Punctularia strigosozonata HHB-11173 SS5]|uniref:uncharacterized protein n=1 Tax=Punctularia strigosozonata (strain HHB-11173) TaxID=741275 RepID=UPI0004416624|nr:uncharacterized protein PUNSTDRAFT_117576 [Punctularia strigosozonata HHB-11173 SS5]EIN13944.1 hypothetical protein PUNSTDRAFT_117576 [Punctularia strigosozonata HHB-11173 SS5]
MPGIASPIFARAHRRPSELPAEAWKAFEENQRDSNIMFPHAIESLAAEKRGNLIEHELWITIWSRRPGSTDTLDFVLACTEGPIDSYPIFIFATSPHEDLTEDHVSPCMDTLVSALSVEVPTERVFSVFGPRAVTISFVEYWTEKTGVELDNEPEYYRATFSSCTRATFKPRSLTVDPHLRFELRPAVAADAEAVAELCFLFAEDSEPFVLTREEGFAEAVEYIRNQQIWVHEISEDGGQSAIASIVAVTRSSDKVAAITKVYTNPEWRSRRCAERLVRHVCGQLLRSGKEAVVLYVALSKPAARKVYHRVGFVGLSESEAPQEDGSEWLELGFDRRRVKLGHW